MKKYGILIALLGVGILSALGGGFFFYGCGQTGSTSTGTVTDYTILGKVSSASLQSAALQSGTAVTDIVAIGANNEKYLADFDAITGTFSIGVTKGWPYVLGFFNKSGAAITLLGYLKQLDVDWDSLPIMNPTTDSTDLGTMEINSISQEARPYISLNDLIAKMNMDTITAQYYGEIDDSLTVLTNLDLDGDGEFDFSEDKHYLFQTYVMMGPGISPVTGEVTKMLSGYNDTYKPQPYAYQFVFSTQGESRTVGTSATLTAPETLTNPDGYSSLTSTGTISADSSGTGWNCFFRLEDELVSLPTSAPSGNYTINIGSDTYTIKNFKASDIVKVDSTNGIIYPVFNLVTNEAGYITTVNYKWMKLVNGVIENADADEVKAAIEDTSNNNTFVHPSPFVSFHMTGESDASPIRFVRDGSSLDVSSYSIKLSDLDYMQAAFNLTSRVVCKFFFDQ